MKKRKVQLSEFMKQFPEKDYGQIYDAIMEQIRKGELKPVKNAGVNGKTPALPLAFWHFTVEEDYSGVYEELKFRLHPMLDTSYYRAYPQKYEKDKVEIRQLSHYLKEHKGLLDKKETMNERSFEIFRREKFFQEKGGLALCGRLGISEEQLNFYRTSEPLSYYSHSKKEEQNILIIENKDTFYDLRRYMQTISNVILGTAFDTLIYGAGKGIWKTFVDYADGAEGYFSGNNRLFYFGDLDYEGIFIYERLVKCGWKNTSGKNICIEPFVAAYEAMLAKAEKIALEELPDRKEKQNQNIDRIFLEYFTEQKREQIWSLWKAGKYIPQEILNEHDWG